MKFVVLALALAVGSLSAQTLKGITVDKTQVEAGQTVTSTVTLEFADTPNRGIRLRCIGHNASVVVKVSAPAVAVEPAGAEASAGPAAASDVA